MKTHMYVKGLRAGGKIRTLEVDPDDTVYSAMAQLEDETGFPPILLRFLCHGDKQLYYDTPGTLADHKLVDPISNNPPVVNVTPCDRGWDRLQRKTLRSLGFDGDDLQDADDPSVLRRRPDYYPGQVTMLIAVTDYIRMDGGERQMRMTAVAEDTVGSIMGRVQRRRRYPVAMQQLKLRDASTYMETPMDKLDATLADYNVNEDSLIELYMSMEFAVNNANRANEETAAAAAAPGEEHKAADDDDEK